LDACAKNPCQNGGKCHVTIDNAIFCECANGYYGIDCSKTTVN